MKPKLIELINFLYEEEQRTGEVYMDKELSFGCTIIYEKNYGMGTNPNGFKERHTRVIRKKSDYNVISEAGVHKTSNIKILGHLGLSSILKYISKSTRDFVGDSKYDCGTDFIYVFLEKSPHEKIPNKEPHLMSDKELDNLITLLKKLGEK